MINFTVVVYHHCLFGIRYDFLCANYTAFDQTLFNCNFASNVDCENSKKFWHRNDELYVEKSTTTVAPAINYNFYTPSPHNPLTPSPVGGLPPLPRDPVELPASRRQASLRPRATRPPVRPLYSADYYDDYEELPRLKSRKRPRPRPRPVYYDDDYEEYEDVRIGRRGGGRRPHTRRERPLRRNNDRRKLVYDDEEYAYDDDDFVLGKKAKRRKVIDDYEYEDDRRVEKRRPQNRREGKPSRKTRPIDDYEYEEDERFDRRKLKSENRDVDKRRVVNDDKETPRLGKRRPPSQEYEDDLQQADEARPYDRSRNKSPEDGRPIIKPVSGTIYDRPRVAPRINLPVPKNAAEKFAYKSVGTPTTAAAKAEDEEYDDYEETVAQPETSDRRSASAIKARHETRSQSKPKDEVSPASSEKERIPEDDHEKEKPKTDRTPNKSTTVESAADHSPMPVIRKFKRPFLPSRGGNPYSSRNLQPVGAKANEETQEIDLGESSIMKSVREPAKTVQKENEPTQKPKQIPAGRAKSPLIEKVTITTAGEESTLRSAIRVKIPVRGKSYLERNEPTRYSLVESTTTTLQPIPAKEDVLNGNYDVTLNEAISPIIPNLPVRGFGGYNPATDYTYKRFQRPTKYVILDPVVSAGNAYYVR